MSVQPPVILERRDRARNMARYYAVRIEPTLFGHWAVIRQWGRLGASGQSRESWFTDLDSALADRAGWERRKRRRGYCSIESGSSQAACPWS